MTDVDHLTLSERHDLGRRVRKRTPRDVFGTWKPGALRPDPIDLLLEQDEAREPDLVPVRHGRMMVSPFTFFRGGAKIMASDLSAFPSAGLNVQLCGDAHLSNFGVFASPERRLLFDLNDFDETLPGPFEYDVARLAASFVVAARDNGFGSRQSRRVTSTAVKAYHKAMAQFAEMRTLDVWYSHLDANELVERGLRSAKGRRRKEAEKGLDKAKSKTSLQALSKLTELVEGQHRIISDPPVLVPGRHLVEVAGISAAHIGDLLHAQLRAYRATLPDDRRSLLERFELIDFARKVVGVGSVGTRCWIALLQGRDGEDPLFLQVKEATKSVLEDHLPKSQYDEPGERVVRGQRLMQAASDIFLGWTRGVEADHYYYWRQLRDMKGSADIGNLDEASMNYYAGACGWTLARAHARSGDPVAIASYLGKNDSFARAMTDFSIRYADQNERDYDEFTKAIASGRIEATEGV